MAWTKAVEGEVMGELKALNRVTKVSWESGLVKDKGQSWQQDMTEFVEGKSCH